MAKVQQSRKFEVPVLITKASGEKVAFNEAKILKSLRRSGASETEVNNVLTELKSHLYEGISTRQIFKHAYSLLRKKSRKDAGRYKLKRAIMELGPHGYHFEKLVAEIFNYQGYIVQTQQTIHGKCVTHEVDVVANKGQHVLMVECKFHNLPGTRCDVKIPLYIHARFQDIEKYQHPLPSTEKKIREGWLVTNTGFTEDAAQYGHCAGLNLLGWNYPSGRGINQLIDAGQLYPVTCLGTLTRFEKNKLLENNILLCRDLVENPDILQNLGINNRSQQVLTEAAEIIHHQNAIVA